VFFDDAFENFCVRDTDLNFTPIPYHFWVAENFVCLILIIVCNGFIIGEVLVNQIQFSIDSRGFKPRKENNINQFPLVIGIRERLAFKVFELIKVGANSISGKIGRTNADECGLEFFEDGLIIFHTPNLIAFGLRKAAQRFALASRLRAAPAC